MVVFGQPPNLADPIKRLLVADAAAKGVSRVRWVNHQAAGRDNLGCAQKQSLLWVRGMNGKVLTHLKAT